MNLVDKVTENKGAIIAALGGVATALIIFNFIKGKPRHETPEEKRKREIEVLRRNINLDNVTYEDIKKVLQYSKQRIKTRLAEFNYEFKEKRLNLPNKIRKQRIREYLDLVADGIEQNAIIPAREQQQIFHQVGLTQAYMKKYQNMILSANRQLSNQKTQDIQHLVPLSLQDTRFGVRQQINFIKNEGMEYANLIIEATRNWPAQKRAQLPMLIPMLVLDGAFEGYPNFDQESVQRAEQLYQKQLMGEIQQLQVTMTPMMLRLNSSVKQVAGFDFSDLQFNGGIGFTPEQMQELKNLEILQKDVQNQALLNNVTQKIFG